MIEWIKFQDKKPSLGDLVVGYDGVYYLVGEWSYHDYSKSYYLSNESGSCCCTDFDDDKIICWALLARVDISQNDGDKNNG